MSKKRSYYDIVVNGADYQVTIGDLPTRTVRAGSVYKAVSKALSKRFPKTYDLKGLHFLSAINIDNMAVDTAQYDYCYTSRGKRKHVVIIVTCDKTQFTDVK